MNASGNVSPLARARVEHATPDPAPGHLWRARWQNQAGVVLVLATSAHRLHVAPVSLDEFPDETAVLSPSTTNTLELDLAVWTNDGAEVPVRALDFKLGELTTSVTDLAPGRLNWGPTDPRTLCRARLQDLIDALAAAAWAPTGDSTLDLQSTLAGSDVASIKKVLGSTPRVAAFRRGQVSLTPDEAQQLSRLLHVPAHDLLAATQPAVPEDLIAAMDLPRIRVLVDQLAQRRNQDEVVTWQAAAYGVLALAARDHDRRDANWSGRIGAYFAAHLQEDADGSQP